MVHSELNMHDQGQGMHALSPAWDMSPRKSSMSFMIKSKERRWVRQIGKTIFLVVSLAFNR